MKAALEGLQRFIETVEQGVSPDQALRLLTHGTFSSLADLEAQFTGGTAPGMEDFLAQLLLYAGDSSAFLSQASLLTLLAGMEGMGLDLMMGLLAAAQSSAAGQEAGLEAALEGGAPSQAPQSASLELEGVTVTGQDLSAVSADEASGALTIGGEADTVLQGTGGEARPFPGEGTPGYAGLRADGGRPLRPTPHPGGGDPD